MTNQYVLFAIALLSAPSALAGVPTADNAELIPVADFDRCGTPLVLEVTGDAVVAGGQQVDDILPWIGSIEENCPSTDWKSAAEWAYENHAEHALLIADEKVPAGRVFAARDELRDGVLTVYYGVRSTRPDQNCRVFNSKISQGPLTEDLRPLSWGDAIKAIDAYTGTLVNRCTTDPTADTAEMVVVLRAHDRDPEPERTDAPFAHLTEHLEEMNQRLGETSEGGLFGGALGDPPPDVWPEGSFRLDYGDPGSGAAANMHLENEGRRAPQPAPKEAEEPK